MVEQLTREFIAREADVHETVPVRPRPIKVDRTFELPTGLYLAMATLFFGFMAVMATGFAALGMIIPVAICVIFMVGFFGVPTIMMRTAPETACKALGWGRFQQEGIMTPFGRATARDATVQMLILPVLIFLWGVCVVTIAALV